MLWTKLTWAVGVAIGTAGTADIDDGGVILRICVAVRREKSTWVAASGTSIGDALIAGGGCGGDSVAGLLDASRRVTHFGNSVNGAVVVVNPAAVVEVSLANVRFGAYESASAVGEELATGSRGVVAEGACSFSREGTRSRDVESSERSAAQRRLASRRDARRPSESSLSEP